jgi:hypothetical protein
MAKMINRRFSFKTKFTDKLSNFFRKHFKVIFPWYFLIFPKFKSFFYSRAGQLTRKLSTRICWPRFYLSRLMKSVKNFQKNTALVRKLLLEIELNSNLLEIHFF